MTYYVRGKYDHVSKSWWVRPKLEARRVVPFLQALLSDGCTAVDVTGWL